MESTKYVVFLRGVNVGGNGTIKMSELKASLEDHGIENVSTYINSGNIVLQSGGSAWKTEEIVKAIISKKFGLSIEMIIKTQAELEKILASDPYSAEESEGSKRLVAMLSAAPGDTAFLQLKEDPRITENYYGKEDLLYIYYSNGAGTSKFSNVYIEKKLKVIATSRNWNTLVKMLKLMKS
jgi:uncharacterized protein (DUF1697 family)